MRIVNILNFEICQTQSYRKVLGDQLIIVSLTMSMEERRKRILVRHSGDKATADRMDVRLQFCNHLFIGLSVR